MRTRSKAFSSLREQPTELDIGYFRSLIDQLLKSLVNPHQRTDTKVQEADGVNPILDDLYALVNAVQHRDPVVSYQPFRDPEFTNTIRKVTRDVKEAYFAWLNGRLKSPKMSVLRQLLDDPTPNFLEVIGKGGEENANSDMIRWLLDPRQAKTIAAPALCALVGSLDKATEWQQAIMASIEHRTLSAIREYSIFSEDSEEGSVGRLDLLICGPGFKLIIENKISSDEHDSQTAIYWDWLKAEPERLKAGMFLTPGGFPAQNHHFKPLSYVDLLSCMLEGPAESDVDGLEKQILASYVKTLAAGVLKRELNIIGERYE